MISKLYAKDISLWIEPDEEDYYDDPELYEKAITTSYEDTQMRLDGNEYSAEYD